MHSERFERALAAIDAANAEDPNSETVDGAAQPRELAYGRRMSAWLERLRPDAPEALRLACRAQHIRRWAIPRDTFPAGRQGYHQWRRRLYDFHADTAAELLRDAGYGEDTIARVRTLLRKEHLRQDPDTQSLEDTACLVFLQYHFPEFATRTEPEKMVDILRRTWGKMSETAHRHALALDLPEEARVLVDRALGGGAE